MNIQDIIDRVSALGLDSEEAAVYVHLSMMGPSRASDLAAAMNLNRSDAYRKLQTLVQKGFVNATLTRPSRFEAAAPEKLFEDLMAAQRARSESLVRARDEIAPVLATLREQADGTGGAYGARNTFKVLQGRREIYAVIERMMRAAGRSVDTITTHAAALSMSDVAGLLDLAVRLARNGVRVRTVLNAGPHTQGRLRAVPNLPELEYRFVREDAIMRCMIVDARKALVWVVNDPSSRFSSERDVAIWTDATDFVALQHTLFAALWRDAARTVDEADRAFSSHPS